MAAFILNRHKSRFKQGNQLIIFLQLIHPFLICRKLGNVIPLRAYALNLIELPSVSLAPQSLIFAPKLQFFNPGFVISSKLETHIVRIRVSVVMSRVVDERLCVGFGAEVDGCVTATDQYCVEWFFDVPDFFVDVVDRSAVL